MPWDDIDWGTVFGSAGQGAGAGASIGMMTGNPLIGLVGGGIGALGGGIASIIGESSAPSYDSIYQDLMSKYTGTDEYKAMNQQLLDLHAQTVEGPTAQEKAALKLALESTNQSFNNKYGSIRNELMARQGIGGNTNAALAAAQGQGTSDTMSDMSVKAASEESARRERFLPIEAQARIASLRMQNEWQKWASGEAYNRRNAQRSLNAQNIGSGIQAIGSVARLGKGAYDQMFNNPAITKVPDVIHRSGSPSELPTPPGSWLNDFNVPRTGIQGLSGVPPVYGNDQPTEMLRRPGQDSWGWDPKPRSY